MSNDLREMLSRRAVEVEIPSLVLDDLVTSGERRLRVRRAGAAVTGAATLALVVGGALAVTHGSDKAGPTPSVETPTQTPTAFPFSSGGNDVVMIDKVVGMTKAAPRPITARITISVTGSEVKNAPAAPAPNMASPAMRIPRRPNRSPTAPANSSNPANTTV